MRAQGAAGASIGARGGDRGLTWLFAKDLEAGSPGTVRLATQRPHGRAVARMRVG
jgi:hypothetical protein